MPYVYRQGAEAEMYVLKPYEYHASNSELVRMLEKGHYGVELTDKEWKTLYNWIDFNAPYYGQFINISKVNEFDSTTVGSNWRTNTIRQGWIGGKNWPIMRKY